jgi:alanyl-tRNA synthetase
VPGTGRFIDDVEGGSDRFVEIWNNVFMEFVRDDSGTLAALPAPSIDTGMGLERVAAVMQGSLSNYDTPLFMPILEATGQLAGRRYGHGMDAADVSMRVIADHLRAMTFLIADGVVPSNEWRGYVLRKIMRRAMRHGRKLGLHEPFLHRLVDIVVTEMGSAYPELPAGRAAITQVIRAEEERFDAVLSGGLPRLEEALERAAAGARVLPGDEAFKLYDTYGLPRDFIEDLVTHQGLAFDAAGFEREMEAQRDKARAKSAFSAHEAAFVWAGEGDLEAEVRALGPTPFVGYDRTSAEVHIQKLLRLDDSGQGVSGVDRLSEGDVGYALITETPFYQQAGGQVSDGGTLATADGEADLGSIGSA